MITDELLPGMSKEMGGGGVCMSVRQLMVRGYKLVSIQQLPNADKKITVNYGKITVYYSKSQ